MRTPIHQELVFHSHHNFACCLIAMWFGGMPDVGHIGIEQCLGVTYFHTSPLAA